MTIPFYCIVIAFVLNYLSKMPLALAMAKSEGGYNNRHPRDQQAKLTGWGRRALAAHQNSFELTPIFAVSVITAHLFSANPEWLAIWSVVFVCSRVGYHALYIADIHVLRSLIWTAGCASITANFILAA